MPDSPLIALIEDEEHLAQGLIFNLQLEGYRTHHESDGDAALAWLLAATAPEAEAPPSVIVLDCMLPGADGFAITRALRDAQRFTPILMLTARSRPQDILEGLEAGADDYLPKPFDLSILLVRIKSLLRRTAWAQSKIRAESASPATALDQPEQSAPDTYTFSGRTIRFDALELISPRGTTHLTVMEADLLRYLSEHEGQIISRSDILEQVWRVHADTDTRAIDNFIVRLRRYIEDDPTHPRHLTTVRGVGYRFLANP
ncbi:MAG TPA: response regulator transcription factor [Acidobacteriaceae bacterium]|nr:response regulator transcription factor [Acidobacteriaceae bacterium]